MTGPRTKLARQVAAHYRRTGTLAACMAHFHLCRDTIVSLLELAGQPRLRPQPAGWPPSGLSDFLHEHEKRLGGHDRARAICANMSGRGCTVEQIVEATGFTRVAVEHHLATARLAKRGNGHG